MANLKKEIRGISAKYSEILNAKKEAISEIEERIEYEERNIKTNEQYLADELEKPEEERYEWRIVEFNREITESKLKIIFYNESIDSILSY